MSCPLVHGSFLIVSGINFQVEAAEPGQVVVKRLCSHAPLPCAVRFQHSHVEFQSMHFVAFQGCEEIKAEAGHPAASMYPYMLARFRPILLGIY